MAADQDWHAALLHRPGKAADALESEMRAVKRRGVIAPQNTQRLNRFVGAFAALMEIKAKSHEFLRAPSAAAYSENRPIHGD
jgi:hypothetical protein